MCWPLLNPKPYPLLRCRWRPCCSVRCSLVEGVRSHQEE